MSSFFLSFQLCIYEKNKYNILNELKNMNYRTIVEKINRNVDNF